MLDPSYDFALERCDWPALRPQLVPATQEEATHFAHTRHASGKLPERDWSICEFDHEMSVLWLLQTLPDGDDVLLLLDKQLPPAMLIGQPKPAIQSLSIS